MKDPAFLFYSSDFLTGTMMMTDQEVGQYIRLLCYQHQCGHITTDAMHRLCGGNAVASIRAKFKTDEDGLFYNQRLEDEMNKRKAHSEKQKANANMRWHKTGIANAMPLENENINENESVIKKRNENEKRREAAIEVLEYLNQTTGRKFETTNDVNVNKVMSLLKTYTVQDCKDVIDLKIFSWGGNPHMDEFIRPKTLFAKENFTEYVAEVRRHRALGTKPNKQTNGRDARVFKEDLTEQALRALAVNEAKRAM